MTARARAARVHIQDLDYGCEEPIELPNDVAVEQPVATLDDHVKSCEPCRKARRPVTWNLLCPEGKRLFTESWRALGLGLPEYAK